jgi:hypothetical protein
MGASDGCWGVFPLLLGGRELLLLRGQKAETGIVLTDGGETARALEAQGYDLERPGNRWKVAMVAKAFGVQVKGGEFSVEVPDDGVGPGLSRLAQAVVVLSQWMGCVDRGLSASGRRGKRRGRV